VDIFHPHPNRLIPGTGRASFGHRSSFDIVFLTICAETTIRPPGSHDIPWPQ
jgi:hypothetical protein